MKKYMFVLALLSLLPVSYANGYEYRSSSSQYTSTNSAAQRYKRARTIRKTGGYHNTINNNFYYGQPAQYQNSRAYVEDTDDGEQVVAKKQYTERRHSEYTSQERKYFLAHPFFQPLKGSVGSVTDIAYAKNNIKFDILNAGALDIDEYSPTYGAVFPNTPLDYSLSGKASVSQFLVKEDVSVGLSDTLALIVMAQYDKTKASTGDWVGASPMPDNMFGNSVSNSGLNVLGIGLQNRFVDNDKWIAMISGYFQHQKDTSNSLGLDFKAGYKVNRTTIYGLTRLGYTNLTDDNIYGVMVGGDASGDWEMLSYKTDVKDVWTAELGAGVFSVLNKYAYVGGELIYGYYDWHNQLSIKGLIGFQPRDSFALSLYASTSLIDSAKNKTRRYMEYDIDPNIQPSNPFISTATTKIYTTGDYKIKSYNEWKIGVQAILYF